MCYRIFIQIKVITYNVYLLLDLKAILCVSLNKSFIHDNRNKTINEKVHEEIFSEDECLLFNWKLNLHGEGIAEENDRGSIFIGDTCKRKIYCDKFEKKTRYGPKRVKQLVQTQGNVIQGWKVQTNRPRKKKTRAHRLEMQAAEQSCRMNATAPPGQCPSWQGSAGISLFKFAYR